MVNKIKEWVYTNGILKPVLVMLIVGLVSWLIISVRDLPAGYATKAELKATKAEISVERDKERDIIISNLESKRDILFVNIEKKIDSGFKSINNDLDRHEKKLDEIVKYIIIYKNKK
uniref:Uncharacterized protein n=1 Tax=viral metagenome TaxID=1070528 RepID=A0A6H1ZK36_9ZZZZ